MNGDGRPRVSVIVAAYNAAATIELCVAALLDQTHAADVIYVVDNGSADGTYEWLMARVRGEPRLCVLREWKKGQSAARNAAIALVKEGIVAFTDADCVPEPDWLANLVASYRDPEVTAVAGAIGGHRPQTVVERYLSMTGFSLPDREVLLRRCVPLVGFPTANLSVRSEILSALGGFDERMPPGEDYDLCWRVLRQGGTILYAPGARVRHIHRSTLRAMLKRLFEYGAVRPRLMRKHFPGVTYVVAGRRALEFRSPFTLCLNLTSPEKVSLAIILLSMVNPWLLGLLGLYWLRLTLKLGSTARDRGIPARSGCELLGFTALHLMEFSASNMGSLSASPRYGVLCL